MDISASQGSRGKSEYDGIVDAQSGNGLSTPDKSVKRVCQMAFGAFGILLKSYNLRCEKEG